MSSSASNHTVGAPDGVRTVTEKTKVKRIILEIIRQYDDCTEQPPPTELHISNAFYLAHLFFDKESPAEYLSVWPILRGRGGPEIKDLGMLLDELVADEEIETGRIESGPFTQLVYSQRKDQAIVGLPEHAIEAIRRAVKEVEGIDALTTQARIRARSHSWRDTKPGGELVIYVDALPEKEYLEQRDQIRADAEIFEAV